MKKQVPESNDHDSQMAELLETLRGHKIFGKYRGGKNKLFVWAVVQVLDQTKTPSEFCRRWDETTADMCVLGNLMATLKRDGKTEALKAFQTALVNSVYTLPGETIALEKTVPITFVMFDPKRTLAMIRWIVQGHWMDLNDYLDGDDFIYRPNTDDSPETIKSMIEHKQKSRTMVHDLFNSFPSLEQASWKRRRQRDYEGWELGYSYQIDVLRKVKIPEEFHPLPLEYGMYNNHIELYPPFAFSQWEHENLSDPQSAWIECAANFSFWVQADQKKVLSKFSREEQENIATWQFHLHPELVEEGISNSMKIGIHPESEHDKWQHKYPTLVSSGVSQGFGAMVYPPEEYTPWCGCKDDVFRVMFRSKSS